MSDFRYYIVALRDLDDTEMEVSVHQIARPVLLAPLWQTTHVRHYTKATVQAAAGWLFGMLHLTAPEKMAAKMNPVKN